MYKAGLLRIDDKRYYVYEVSNSKYYRLDICKEGTKFHVEPEGILYSIYRRKKEFVFGNPFYKGKFDEIKRLVSSCGAETKIESGWANKKFRTTHVKQDEDSGVFCEIIKENNIITKETYMAGGDLLVLQMGQDIADMVMEPLNASQYVSASIEQKVGETILYNDLDTIKSRFNLDHLLARDYKTITDLDEANEYLKIIEDYYNDMVKKILEYCKIYDKDPSTVTSKEITKYFQMIGQENVDWIRMIGADTETTGVDMNYFGKDKITGVVVSIGKHVSRYFPFGHEKFDNLPFSYFFDLMKVLVKVQRLTAGHNIKFEHKVAYKYGVDWCIYHDSFEASIINDPRVMNGIHALKTLESEIDGQKYISFKDMFIGEANFAHLPLDLVTLYACPDPDGTVAVWENQMKKMEGKNQNAIYRLECELANLKAEQEYWGFRVNHDEFIKGLDNCEFVVSELEKMIKLLAGKSDFNINSQDQLANHLYNELHCPIVARTKAGKPGTGKNAIVKLSKIKRQENDKVIKAKSDFVDKEGHPIVSAKELNEARYPITILLLAYKKWSKLLTGFYNRLLNSSKAQFKIEVQDDGRRKVQYTDAEGRNCVRFFFWINANGTESGRQSSTMHTMPGEIKRFFIADSEEHDIIDADYAQVELRVLPSLAEETELKELCSDENNDIHRVIGALITGKDVWEISEEERKADKARNFGVVYLISASGLAEQKYGAMPSKDQVSECNVSILKFFDRFKRIRHYLDQNEKDILEKGEIYTMWNRVRRFPQIFDPNIDNNRKRALVRQGNNMPVQGTAADIMKLAEVKYYNYIKAKGWDKLVKTPQGEYPLVRVMLSIHDEVLISRHISIPIEEIFEMQRTCQEIKIENFTPLFANPAIIDNWGEGKEDHFEVPKGLRDRLIDDYHRTGKSAFPPNTHLKDIMRQRIKEYKSAEIIEYMEGLIAEYGEDPEVIAEKIRHPRLTHDIISTHKSDNHKYLSHLERIRFAAELYIKNRGNKDYYKNVDVQQIAEDKDDEEVLKGIQSITGFIDSIVGVDELGELMENEDDEEEEFEVYDNESEEEFVKRVNFKKYAWSHRDSYLIDCSSLTVKECDKVLDFVEQYSSEDGFLPINIYFAGKNIFSEMKTDSLDVKEVDKFIENLKTLRTDNILFNNDKNYKG